MTRDEIAEASEEQLRIWVAEKVMGWRWLLPPGVDCAALLPPSFDNPYWKPAPNGIVACDDYQETMARFGGTWSTNITAAWQVVEKVHEMYGAGCGPGISINCLASGGVECTIYGHSGHWRVFSEKSAPEAVCKAALLAVMEADNEVELP